MSNSASGLDLPGNLLAGVGAARISRKTVIIELGRSRKRITGRGDADFRRRVATSRLHRTIDFCSISPPPLASATPEHTAGYTPTT